MYARRVAERELTFGVSGKLYRNVLVMYDRQTGSLWSHLLGSAFAGPLKGSRLRTVPAVHAEWEQWLRAYPGTVVLSKDRSPYGRYREDPYAGYYYSPQTGLIPPVERDTRVFPKEFVLGVALPGGAKAYPYSRLGGRPWPAPFGGPPCGRFRLQPPSGSAGGTTTPRPTFF